MTAALTPRRPWDRRRVVLGVTGGIAAYKAVQVARDLTLLGATVDVVMTRGAHAFVGPITFESLTGRRVLADIFEQGRALEHIRLAREADLICVAPATADFIARAAVGRADDLLTAILLAARSPVLICPAMNDWMWTHPQTQANVRHIQDSLGYSICGPASGPLAHGEGEGEGRLEEPEVVLAHAARLLAGETPFTNLRVIVTAGPTREAVDPVRILSNRSSGRMGFEIAGAAWRRGANVLLISGPTQLEPPPGPTLQRVESAEAMALAVRQAIREADVLIMAAAAADFRPATPEARKIKKAAGAPTLELEDAPDILQATRADRPATMLAIGFALETDDAERNARRKLQEKALDVIVLNRANDPGAGFETDTNRVTIIDSAGTEESLPLLPKHAVAEAVLDRVERLLPSHL
ncbi:MAG: bifunctional phosphopantothenoylcysteine decarboxylase/phosphopantothenate--cysteine ligase CoaBC [Longimicrobiales bacterium]